MDGDPTDTEKDFWEIAALEAYNHLTEWKSLQYCATVNIEHNLSKMWDDPFYQVGICPCSFYKADWETNRMFCFVVFH